MAQFIVWFFYDTFEEYTYEPLDGLDGGHFFKMLSVGPYVDRSQYFGLQCYDNFEDYTSEAAANGLSWPHWPQLIVDRTRYLGLLVSDSFESYTDEATFNGLNAGTSWSAAWTAAYADHTQA
jgi:hypothetical protein